MNRKTMDDGQWTMDLNVEVQRSKFRFKVPMHVFETCILFMKQSDLFTLRNKDNSTQLLYPWATKVACWRQTKPFSHFDAGRTSLLLANHVLLPTLRSIHISFASKLPARFFFQSAWKEISWTAMKPDERVRKIHGVNAAYLASQGFEVTAIVVAPAALEAAEEPFSCAENHYENTGQKRGKTL